MLGSPAGMGAFNLAGSKALSAEGKAKPAGSEQLAAIRTTDYKTASSKKSTPLPGFSKFRFAYCILLTANCLLVSSGGAKK